MRIVVLGNPKSMWLAWKTQPDESLGGTVRGLLHGKLQGGSSAINGLMRARGNPATTTTGRKRERLGWNYASLLP